MSPISKIFIMEDYFCGWWRGCLVCNFLPFHYLISKSTSKSPVLLLTFLVPAPSSDRNQRRGGRQTPACRLAKWIFAEYLSAELGFKPQPSLSCTRLRGSTNLATPLLAHCWLTEPHNRLFRFPPRALIWSRNKWWRHSAIWVFFGFSKRVVSKTLVRFEPWISLFRRKFHAN